MNDEVTIACNACHKEIPVGEFFGTTIRYWPPMSLLQYNCLCGSMIDYQVHLNEVVLGYVYGAGTAHFSPEVNIPITGVNAEYRKDHCLLTYGSQSYRIEAIPQSST